MMTNPDIQLKTHSPKTISSELSDLQISPEVLEPLFQYVYWDTRLSSLANVYCNPEYCDLLELSDTSFDPRLLVATNLICLLALDQLPKDHKDPLHIYSPEESLGRSRFDSILSEALRYFPDTNLTYLLAGYLPSLMNGEFEIFSIGPEFLREQLNTIEKAVNSRRLERESTLAEELLVVVFHEMKNYLAQIFGYSALLSTTDIVENREAMTSSLRVVTEAVQRIQTIFETLPSVRELMRSNGGTVIDMEQLFSEVKLFNPDKCRFSPEKYQIEERNLFPEGKFVGHLPLLKIALINFLNNAYEYCNQEDPRIEIYSRFEGDGKVVGIFSNGEALSQEVVDKLQRNGDAVEPFKRLNGRSWGIGLRYIVKLLEFFNYKLKVIPVEGQGNCFEVHWN